jgi:hypothetical protein
MTILAIIAYGLLALLCLAVLAAAVVAVALLQLWMEELCGPLPSEYAGDAEDLYP